jgi:hypothetical protein
VLPQIAMRLRQERGENSLDGANLTFETMPNARKEPCRDLAFS